MLGLVGVFGFVVHNQFSGDGEEVASANDEKKPGPAGSLGTEGDPNAANDPFAEKEPGGGEPNAAEPGVSSLVLNGQDEPSPDAELNGLLSDQFEPGIGGQTGGAGATDDPFGNTEPAGTAPGSINVASRDSVFGGPSSFDSQPANDSFGANDPFGTEPTGASSLPDAGPLVSQNDPSGLGASQPAAMLPDADLLTGGPQVGTTTADPFGADPFSSQPAAGSSSKPANERPLGLFDDKPAGGSSTSGTALAGRRGDAFDSGFSSESGLGQSGGLNAPLPGEAGFGSEPTGSLPSVASNGGLPGSLPESDPFGQPSLGNSEPSLDPAPLGNEPLLGNSSASPVMLGNDLEPAEPFGTEPTNEFKTPVVAGQNDPFGGSRLSSQPTLDSPGTLDSRGAFGSATDSTTTIRPRPAAGTLASGGSTYTVEESDSFWSISKKVYGTSRYFEALQKYNRAKIDDPKKLKPGMVLDTPSAAILADYLDGGAVVSPQAIADGGRSRSGLPTAASSMPATVGSPRSTGSPAGFSGGILPIEPTGESETVQTVASSPSATTVGDSTKAGFFIGNQGYPMYRVANGDTLTAIAADHLGRASRWKQIFRMNQDALKSPDALAPGVVLKLPGDASRVPLIDRTSSLR